MFQHTATRRWLPILQSNQEFIYIVSTHSHPKVAAIALKCKLLNLKVSTHSHPKVAAWWLLSFLFFKTSFNTQPPEGGCS